jgi:hypothetical protein
MKIAPHPHPNAATLACLEKSSGLKVDAIYQPLESVNRPAVDTAAAAYYLNRRPQTMRCWACHENGPIRPFRINGRLAWSVSELRRVLGVA